MDQSQNYSHGSSPDLRQSMIEAIRKGDSVKVEEILKNPEFDPDESLFQNRDVPALVYALAYASLGNSIIVAPEYDKIMNSIIVYGAKINNLKIEDAKILLGEELNKPLSDASIRTMVMHVKSTFYYKDTVLTKKPPIQRVKRTIREESKKIESLAPIPNLQTSPSPAQASPQELKKDIKVLEPAIQKPIIAESTRSNEAKEMLVALKNGDIDKIGELLKNPNFDPSESILDGAHVTVVTWVLAGMLIILPESKKEFAKGQDILSLLIKYGAANTTNLPAEVVNLQKYLNENHKDISGVNTINQTIPIFAKSYVENKRNSVTKVAIQRRDKNSRDLAPAIETPVTPPPQVAPLVAKTADAEPKKIEPEKTVENSKTQAAPLATPSNIPTPNVEQVKSANIVPPAMNIQPATPLTTPISPIVQEPIKDIPKPIPTETLKEVPSAATIATSTPSEAYKGEIKPLQPVAQISSNQPNPLNHELLAALKKGDLNKIEEVLKNPNFDPSESILDGAHVTAVTWVLASMLVAIPESIKDNTKAQAILLLLIKYGAANTSNVSGETVNLKKYFNENHSGMSPAVGSLHLSIPAYVKPYVEDKRNSVPKVTIQRRDKNSRDLAPAIETPITPSPQAIIPPPAKTAEAAKKVEPEQIVETQKTKATPPLAAPSNIPTQNVEQVKRAIVEPPAMNIQPATPLTIPISPIVQEPIKEVPKPIPTETLKEVVKQTVSENVAPKADMIDSSVPIIERKSEVLPPPTTLALAPEPTIKNDVPAPVKEEIKLPETTKKVKKFGRNIPPNPIQLEPIKEPIKEKNASPTPLRAVSNTRANRPIAPLKKPLEPMHEPAKTIEPTKFDKLTENELPSIKTPAFRAVIVETQAAAAQKAVERKKLKDNLDAAANDTNKFSLLKSYETSNYKKAIENTLSESPQINNLSTTFAQVHSGRTALNTGFEENYEQNYPAQQGPVKLLKAVFHWIDNPANGCLTEKSGFERLKPTVDQLDESVDILKTFDGHSYDLQGNMADAYGKKVIDKLNTLKVNETYTIPVGPPGGAMYMHFICKDSADKKFNILLFNGKTDVRKFEGPAEFTKPLYAFDNVPMAKSRGVGDEGLSVNMISLLAALTAIKEPRDRIKTNLPRADVNNVLEKLQPLDSYRADPDRFMTHFMLSMRSNFTAYKSQNALLLQACGNDRRAYKRLMMDSRTLTLMAELNRHADKLGDPDLAVVRGQLRDGADNLYKMVHKYVVQKDQNNTAILTPDEAKKLLGTAKAVIDRVDAAEATARSRQAAASENPVKEIDREETAKGAKDKLAYFDAFIKPGSHRDPIISTYTPLPSLSLADPAKLQTDLIDFKNCLKLYNAGFKKDGISSTALTLPRLSPDGMRAVEQLVQRLPEPGAPYWNSVPKGEVQKCLELLSEINLNYSRSIAYTSKQPSSSSQQLTLFNLYADIYCMAAKFDKDSNFNYLQDFCVDISRFKSALDLDPTHVINSYSQLKRRQEINTYFDNINSKSPLTQQKLFCWDCNSLDPSTSDKKLYEKLLQHPEIKKTLEKQEYTTCIKAWQEQSKAGPSTDESYYQSRLLNFDLGKQTIQVLAPMPMKLVPMDSTKNTFNVEVQIGHNAHKYAPTSILNEFTPHIALLKQCSISQAVLLSPKTMRTPVTGKEPKDVHNRPIPQKTSDSQNRDNPDYVLANMLELERVGISQLEGQQSALQFYGLQADKNILNNTDKREFTSSQLTSYAREAVGSTLATAMHQTTGDALELRQNKVLCSIAGLEPEKSKQLLGWEIAEQASLGEVHTHNLLQWMRLNSEKLQDPETRALLMNVLFRPQYVDNKLSVPLLDVLKSDPDHVLVQIRNLVSEGVSRYYMTQPFHRAKVEPLTFLLELAQTVESNYLQMHGKTINPPLYDKDLLMQVMKLEEGAPEFGIRDLILLRACQFTQLLPQVTKNPDDKLSITDKNLQDAAIARIRLGESGAEVDAALGKDKQQQIEEGSTQLVKEVLVRMKNRDFRDNFVERLNKELKLPLPLAYNETNGTPYFTSASDGAGSWGIDLKSGIITFNNYRVGMSNNPPQKFNLWNRLLLDRKHVYNLADNTNLFQDPVYNNMKEKWGYIERVYEGKTFTAVNPDNEYYLKGIPASLRAGYSHWISSQARGRILICDLKTGKPAYVQTEGGYFQTADTNSPIIRNFNNNHFSRLTNGNDYIGFADKQNPESATKVVFPQVYSDKGEPVSFQRKNDRWVYEADPSYTLANPQINRLFPHHDQYLLLERANGEQRLLILQPPLLNPKGAITSDAFDPKIKITLPAGNPWAADPKNAIVRSYQLINGELRGGTADDTLFLVYQHLAGKDYRRAMELLRTLGTSDTLTKEGREIIFAIVQCESDVKDFSPEASAVRLKALCLARTLDPNFRSSSTRNAIENLLPVLNKDNALELLKALSTDSNLTKSGREALSSIYQAVMPGFNAVSEPGKENSFDQLLNLLKSQLQNRSDQEIFKDYLKGVKNISNDLALTDRELSDLNKLYGIDKVSTVTVNIAPGFMASTYEGLPWKMGKINFPEMTEVYPLDSIKANTVNDEIRKLFKEPIHTPQVFGMPVFGQSEISAHQFKGLYNMLKDPALPPEKRDEIAYKLYHAFNSSAFSNPIAHRESIARLNLLHTLYRMENFKEAPPLPQSPLDSDASCKEWHKWMIDLKKMQPKDQLSISLNPPPLSHGENFVDRQKQQGEVTISNALSSIKEVTAPRKIVLQNTPLEVVVDLALSKLINEHFDKAKVQAPAPLKPLLPPANLNKEQIQFSKAIEKDFEFYNQEMAADRNQLLARPAFNLKGERKELIDDLNAFLDPNSGLEKKLIGLENDIIFLLMKPRTTTSVEGLSAYAHQESTRIRTPKMIDIVRACVKGTPEAYRELNPYLTDEAIFSLQRQTLEYMLNTTTLQQVKQSQLFLSKWNSAAEKAEKFDAEIKTTNDQKQITELTAKKNACEAEAAAYKELGIETLTSPRAYSCNSWEDIQNNTYPIYFEYKTELRVREKQIELINKITTGIRSNQEELSNIVFQLIMGGGKTSVIISWLLDIISEEDDRLAALVLHPSQFDGVLGNVQKYQKERYNKELVPIGATREELKDLDTVKRLLKVVETAKTDRNAIAMRSTFSQVLLLELRRISADLRDSKIPEEDLPREMQRLSALGNILLIFQEKGVLLIDEVDMVLNIIQQLNFPKGEKMHLSPEQIELTSSLFLAMFDIKPATFGANAPQISPEDFKKDFVAKLCQASLDKRKVPAEHHAAYVRYLKNDIDGKLETDFVSAVKKDTNIGHLSSTQQEDVRFLRYLWGHTADSKGSKIDQAEAGLQALSRFMISTILPQVLTQEPGRHVGYHPSGNGKVIPYLGRNNPATTELANPDESVAASALCCLTLGIPLPAIVKVAETMSEAAEAHAEKYNDFDEIPEAQKFFEMTSVKLSVARQGKDLDKISNYLSKHPAQALEFQANLDLIHVTYNQNFLTAKAYDIPNLGKANISCTGTPQTRDTFERIRTTYLDEGSEGKILDEFRRQGVGQNATILPSEGKASTNFINLIAAADADKSKGKLGAIIDAGGILKGVTGEQFAREYLTRFKGDPERCSVVFVHRYPDPATGAEVVSFAVLRRDLNSNEIEKTPMLIKDTTKDTLENVNVFADSMFVIYGEPEITGVDFKLSPTCNAYLTSNPYNITFDKLEQAGLRMRQIFVGQKILHVISENHLDYYDKKQPTAEQVLTTALVNQAMRRPTQVTRAYADRIRHVPLTVMQNELIRISAETTDGNYAELRKFVDVFGKYLDTKTGTDLLEKYGKLSSSVDSLKHLEEVAAIEIHQFPKIYPELKANVEAEEKKLLSAAAKELEKGNITPKMIAPSGLDLGTQMELATESQLEAKTEKQTQVEANVANELMFYDKIDHYTTYQEVQWTGIDNLKGELPSIQNSGVGSVRVEDHLKKNQDRYYNNVCFSEIFTDVPLYLSNNFVNSIKVSDTQSTLPIFSPAHKKISHLLVVKGVDGKASLMALSNSDFNAWSKQIAAWKGKGLEKPYWIVNLNGELAAGKGKLIDEKSYQFGDGIQDLPSYKMALWHANLFNGNILQLEKDMELSQEIIQKGGKKSILEGGKPYRDFLAIRVAKNPNLRRQLNSSEILNESKSKTGALKLQTKLKAPVQGIAREI